jgi:hypothetical protein
MLNGHRPQDIIVRALWSEKPPQLGTRLTTGQRSEMLSDFGNPFPFSVAGRLYRLRSVCVFHTSALIVRTVIEEARQGHMVALRLCLDCIMQARRPRVRLFWVEMNGNPNNPNGTFSCAGTVWPNFIGNMQVWQAPKCPCGTSSE